MKMTWRWKPEAGIELDGIWVPYEVLEELEDHPYDSLGTGDTVLLSHDVGHVLRERRLAVQETRGGWHAGSELRYFMEQLEHTPAPEARFAWLAEMNPVGVAVSGAILGLFSQRWRAEKACQDEANRYLGEKSTPALQWQDSPDKGYGSASYHHPGDDISYLFQITRFTLDEAYSP
jgi:hypothetical protein